MVRKAMAEYFEREAALALVRPDAPEDEKTVVTIATAKKLVRSIVRRTPAADVAPVVRCKDCTSTRKKDDYESVYLCDEVLICTNSEYGWQPVRPNHFCSYGCPRDGDEDAKES